MTRGHDGEDENVLSSLLHPHARVCCLLCGSDAGWEPLFGGCQACGVAAPLEMVYETAPWNGLGPREAAAAARRAYAPFAASTREPPPLPPTPLVAAPRFGAGVFLKNEAVSLTSSHKDRYHLVASRVATLLGCRGVVASSTGNHGVSAAAHAAAAGLRSVVFCHPQAPAGLLRAIGAFGGVAAQLEPEAQQGALSSLVREGWFPATSMDPALSGAANPFGGEGYKAVAYEIVEQLGAMPDAVFIPTAGGDTLYGMSKGLAEMAALSGTPMPRVCAIQPTGANALSQSLAVGRQVTLDHPESIALSLSDPRSGRHAMEAIRRWGGRAIDVTEGELRRAIADLAGMGIYTDPASAAALAGYQQAVAREIVKPGASAVLLLTSSGFKWPDAMAEVFTAGSVRSMQALQERLTAR